MFQKKFKCLGEADEFDTIHRKSGHFFSTVRYDFADIIVGVAGHGRGRTIGRWFVEFAQEAVVLIHCSNHPVGQADCPWGGSWASMGDRKSVV